MKKRLAGSGIGAAALTLMLGVGVFAQNGTEQKVEFFLDGKIGNELVRKGSYKITVPEAEQGTVEIKVGKKTISAPFTKRANEKEAEKDKMTYVENSDGSRSLATITPRGQKYTIVLNDAAGGVVSGK